MRVFYPVWQVTELAAGYRYTTLHLLGDVAMHREPPDIDQATAHYRQALAVANELGMRPLQAHCHRGLGTLYAATEQREQACTELSTAIALYRDMEMTFWLPQTEAALAQVEGHSSGDALSGLVALHSAQQRLIGVPRLLAKGAPYAGALR